MPSNFQAALRQYQNYGNAGTAAEASPHKLIDMLLSGALDRLAAAKGCVQRGERAQKLQAIASAVAIVEHLRLCLDTQAGGDIARNLAQLYDYMLRRLFKANAEDNAAIIEEVSGLMRELKLGWEAMQGAPERRH